MTRLYQIVIVILLIGFIFLGTVTFFTVKDIRHKIDVDINTLYEYDLSNRITLSDKAIAILQRIDNY